MPSFEIRPAVPADSPALVALASATGVFKPLEIETLEEVLADYHGGNRDAGHRCAVCHAGGVIAGFTYHAPAAMTDRTWYLYWLAVDPTIQRGGVGGRLLHWSEDEVRAAGGRLLVIETSGLPHYAPARAFYLRQGYESAACLRDFYADGDDMAVFTKHLLRAVPR